MLDVRIQRYVHVTAIKSPELPIYPLGGTSSSITILKKIRTLSCGCTVSFQLALVESGIVRSINLGKRLFCMSAGVSKISHSRSAERLKLSIRLALMEALQ